LLSLAELATCYFARANPLSGDYALLLEDLAPLSITDLGLEAREADLFAVVQSLAGLHARFLGDLKQLQATGVKNWSSSEAPQWDAGSSLISETRNKGWKQLMTLKFDVFSPSSARTSGGGSESHLTCVCAACMWCAVGRQMAVGRDARRRRCAVCER
jgi:hypothetical protein